ncbi:MAG: manganese efflux pump, partial [Acetanaerobacterium sp.]
CDIKGELTAKTIAVQAFATSIDALAVGVSLAAMNVSILYSASTIAGVTFVLCLLGACIGNRLGAVLKDKAEIFGGVILVLIGVKIFIEHTCF